MAKKKSTAVRSKIQVVEEVAHAKLPTRYGQFTIHGFRGLGPQDEAVALVRGKIRGPFKSKKSVPMVRVHSQCLTGDVLNSLRCDCRAQLELSMKTIGQAPAGILLYLPQEGRGIGLMNKLRAYELQDQGMDTVEANEALGHPADKRDYGIGAQILADIGVRKIRLISNSPRKYHGVEGIGLEVVEQVPIQIQSNPHNERYLKTKKEKLGHLLD